MQDTTAGAPSSGEAQPGEATPAAASIEAADAPQTPNQHTPHIPTAPGRIAVGRINGIWGMKGHVKVSALTTNEDRLKADSVVLVLGRPTKIVEMVQPQGYPIIRFQGYPDRTAAERLRDTYIEIDEKDLPSLPEDEYYIDDLVGLEVVTTEGESIGQLTDVLGTGANDVYVVARPGKKDALIPAISDIVLSIDLEAERVTIDVIPGLLD